ncbi:hypothetical protein ACFPZ0_15235 [Streptomonospora nanhaiensis]|uniref:DUF4352 domain-containing protein n=1 Tax=Streptomonospora nanhaiensis TaxID=1323731 RepID=A0A853BLP8_9ACTN|nr:hypothetical protein [Streptomonospora nanhaiensis]MBX9389674.1 hypothetical protein [Streptomonospora nanhaiensis]NYI95597.1 hypothetical protein [Streptomonospora nanhaiensis]
MEKKRYLVHCLTWTVAATSLLVVPFSSASAAATSPSPSPGSESTPGTSASPALGSTESSGELENVSDAMAEVLDLKHSTSSGLTVLTVRITNTGTENIHANNFANPIYDYRHTHLSGVTLLDESSQIRHHPLIDAETNCLCSGYVSLSPYDPLIEPNQSVDYWTTYRTPSDTASFTVEIPGFDPIENVPVG